MRALSTAPRLHRTIWYMGSKVRVIPGFLERVLGEELEEGDTVLDLMSGTGVVSSFCADRYRVLANDVLRFSSLITRSLIEHEPETRDAFLADIDPLWDLHDAYESNRHELERLLAPALKEEGRLLREFERISRSGGGGAAFASWARRYRGFLADAGGRYPLEGGRPRQNREGLYRKARGLLAEASILRRRKDPTCRPACLATSYYGNVYFGLRQAIVIDSLRVAVDAMPADGRFAAQKRAHYLSALIHAASVSTSGTSHFAQPRHLDKDSELRAVAFRRCLDVFQSFLEYNDEISATVARTSYRRGNAIFCGDYRGFVGADGGFDLPGKIDLVYLDPPYTADHYSRFYHVLEVLARYDYPELERSANGEVVRGRYPVISERFRSGFCRRGEVEDEFRAVIRASARSGAKLVISYGSPTGLLLRSYAEKGEADPVERFRRLCLREYREVRVLRKPMMHSGQGDSSLNVEELLVVCTEPR